MTDESDIHLSSCCCDCITGSRGGHTCRSNRCSCLGPAVGCAVSPQLASFITLNAGQIGAFLTIKSIRRKFERWCLYHAVTTWGECSVVGCFCPSTLSRTRDHMGRLYAQHPRPLVLKASQHELGHAFAASSFHVPVTGYGVRRWYFMLSAYVTIDTHRMQRTAQLKQLSILSGGVIHNVVRCIAAHPSPHKLTALLSCRPSLLSQPSEC